MTTSGPNPGSGPENLGLGQMWSLLVVWRVFILNVATSTMGLGQMSKLLVQAFSKQPKTTTSGPNPGSRPENMGLGQMWSLLVVLERVYTEALLVQTSPETANNDHIWPKPRLSARKHGFGRCGGLFWLFWMG